MQHLLNVTVQGLIGSLAMSVFILIIVKKKPYLLLHGDLC